MDDNKKTQDIGDNRNAPGTYPDLPTPKPQTNEIAAVNESGDPKAPRKADPLNQGMPTQEANGDDWIDIEDEVGGTGTLIFSGFLTGNDYNPDWRGWNRIKIVDEMRLSDATIQQGLSAVKYPILAANWYIKPGQSQNGENLGDDDPKRMFIHQEVFQNPNYTFTHLLRQALLYCEYGQMFFEKVWRTRLDGKIGWKKFAPRLPSTILRYTLNDGITPGIVQILPTGGPAEIPMWKLLMLVLDMEGSNYEGRSLLRSAYQHYFYKKLYYKIDAIASERQGMGIPVVHYPSQASPQDKRQAEMYAQNLRVNEYAYSGLPTGFTIEWLDTKAKGLKDVEKMILHHTRQELAAFRAQFLDLGATTAGSENASNDQTELFYLSLNYIARTFQEPMNMAIRELIDLNFSNTKPTEYPTLEYAKLGNTNILNYSRSILFLSQAGILSPDESLVQHARSTLDLPEADRDSMESYLDPAGQKYKIPQLDIVPPDGTTTDPKTGQSVMNVKAKPPVKYLNAEQLRKSQIEFAEKVNAMNELEKRVLEAIEKKKTIV
jgi:hypothetical protein